MIETITIDTEQWAVVPRVPTQEMQKAGFIANNKVQGCSDPDEPCCHCGDGFGERDGCGHAAVAAYSAMLAAAPRPEAGQQSAPIPAKTYPRGGDPVYNVQLPTKADADCTGRVWAWCSRQEAWVHTKWDDPWFSAGKFCYWQPTGLVRPAEPDGGAV